MECFWLPGRPTPSTGPGASALSRLDSSASEVLPVSSQAPGFLGETCTRIMVSCMQAEQTSQVHMLGRVFKPVCGIILRYLDKIILQ